MASVISTVNEWWFALQNDWWASLPSFQKFFWLLAIPFTVVFLIQMFSTFLGMGGELDEADGLDGEGATDLFGVRLLTIGNLIVFFMVFGWTGITLSQGEYSQAVTVLLSVILGVVIVVIVGTLFYFVMRLAQSGTTNVNHAKGLIGEVYVPIPGNKQGVGKIMVTFQGSLKEVDAMTAGGSLARGTLVQVIEVTNGHILLVKANEKGSDVNV